MFRTLYAAILMLAVLAVPDGRARASSGVFVPTSGWLVGPAALLPEDEESFSMPCVMANQYNNGFILRFSGGGGKIYAMAFDLRQDAFEKGSDYEALIAVDSDYETEIRLKAHNGGTVLASLQNEQGIYAALKKGKRLVLTIGSSRLEFSLAGVRDGLARVEQCHSPDDDSGRTAENSRGWEPPPAGMREIASPAFTRALESETAGKPPPLPQQAAEGDAVPAAAEAGPKQAESYGNEMFEDMARKMEQFNKMLDRTQPPEQAAASAAPVRGQNPAPAAGQQENDMQAEMERKMAQLDSILASAAQKLAALEPAAGEAVTPAPRPVTAPQQPAALPMGRPLASTWAQPGMDIGQQQNAGLKKSDILEAGRLGGHAAPAVTERRWRAIRGTNLHEVLDVWTRHESARLVWQADEEIAVRESFTMKGSFEEAVYTLLQQHSGEKLKPVGRIYIDPSIHQKVLLIEMKQGS